MNNDYWNDYLAHYGVEGMKWGVRNYQNADGSLTQAGRLRYGRLGNKLDKTNAKIDKYTKKRDKALAKASKGVNQYTDLGANQRRKLAKYDVKLNKAKKKAEYYSNQVSDISVSELKTSKEYAKTYSKGMGISYALLGIPGAVGYGIYKSATYDRDEYIRNN